MRSRATSGSSASANRKASRWSSDPCRDATGRSRMTDPHRSTPSGKPRARGLGLVVEGMPGPWNAITDVPGVAVGYTTLIAGQGPLVVGQGPVRTGVTAILPRPVEDVQAPVFAGFHSFNGDRKSTRLNSSHVK